MAAREARALPKTNRIVATQNFPCVKSTEWEAMR